MKKLSSLKAPDPRPYPYPIPEKKAHFVPGKVLSLMRDGGSFTPSEIEHLKYCETCHDWIAAFADLGRISGLKNSLELPHKLRRRTNER